MLSALATPRAQVWAPGGAQAKEAESKWPVWAALGWGLQHPSLRAAPGFAKVVDRRVQDV